MVPKISKPLACMHALFKGMPEAVKLTANLLNNRLHNCARFASCNPSIEVYRFASQVTEFGEEATAWPPHKLAQDLCLLLCRPRMWFWDSLVLWQTFALSLALVLATPLSSYYQLTVVLAILILGFALLSHLHPFQAALSQSVQVLGPQQGPQMRPQLCTCMGFMCFALCEDPKHGCIWPWALTSSLPDLAVFDRGH